MKRIAKYFYFFIITFNFSLFSIQNDLEINNNNTKKNPICISLGMNCQVASQLRIHGIRTAAFPFDWLGCPFEALCLLLENDFADFLNPEYLKLDVTKTYVINEKFGHFFLHDFPVLDHNIISEDWMLALASIQEKYTRRIKRFYSIGEEADNIYFFRIRSTAVGESRRISKEDAIRLRDLLFKKFPKLNWTLIIIDDSYLIKEDWQIPNIKNYYLKHVNPGKAGIGSVIGWDNIFEKLDIKYDKENENYKKSRDLYP